MISPFPKSINNIQFSNYLLGLLSPFYSHMWRFILLQVQCMYLQLLWIHATFHLSDLIKKTELCMCLYIGVCMCVQVPAGVQKRVLDPLELKLQVVGCEAPSMGAGNWTLPVCWSTKISWLMSHSSPPPWLLNWRGLFRCLDFFLVSNYLGGSHIFCYVFLNSVVTGEDTFYDLLKATFCVIIILIPLNLLRLVLWLKLGFYW